ncbi:MAG: STAS domain-containing protein [Ginsengibacter sp.]
MNFKIDTKEKMYVITVEEDFLTVNMTGEMRNLLLPYLDQTIKNIIINLKQVNQLDVEMAVCLAEIQATFYEAGNSMVLCELKKNIQNYLDEKDLSDQLNITPTESEAWDIVQMEEIEREFL